MGLAVTFSWICDHCGRNSDQKAVTNESLIVPKGWNSEWKSPTPDTKGIPNTAVVCDACGPTPDWKAQIAAAETGVDVDIPRNAGVPDYGHRWMAVQCQCKPCSKRFTANFDEIIREIACPNCGTMGQTPEYTWGTP